MTDQSFQITVNDKPITAITTLPENQDPTSHFIYAPGAGSNINDLFGKYLSQRLGTSGIATVRFQFPYMEDRKRRPDSPKLLEDTLREVIQSVRSSATKLVIGGRSMGGRIASQVVAQGTPVDGLALFAYPLRPPTNPSTVRDDHFPEIGVPTLFCSGTRDAFGTPEELQAAASKVPNSKIHLLDGADHGFGVLKSSGRTKDDVWREATDGLLAWLHDQT